MNQAQQDLGLAVTSCKNPRIEKGQQAVRDDPTAAIAIALCAKWLPCVRFW
jgi:hypothetical protein